MRNAASRVDLAQVEVVSMRELVQHTAAVIQRLRAEDVPRVVVKHGRFQAVLWPLSTGIEDLLSSAVNLGDLSVAGSAEGVPVQDLIQNPSAAQRVDASVDAPEAAESHRSRDQTFGMATMAELNQGTSAVVDRVHRGEHLVITRHGHFVALLVPLPPNLESLLGRVPDFTSIL